MQKCSRQYDKNDETIKSFMVVGFSSDANSNSSSNGQIVGAAGGYNDTNNNFIKKDNIIPLRMQILCRIYIINLPLIL